MAKQGMARPERTHTQPKNQMPPVPEIQGKAKSGKKEANPIISGTSGPSQKVFHTERPIKDPDNDLARDHIKNDLPEADLQDL